MPRSWLSKTRIPDDLIVTHFWSKVNKSGPVIRPELGPCWIWTDGHNGAGYGRFSVHRKIVYAHRFACELTHGPLLPKQVARHKCDNGNGGCVRPEHIEPGTAKDNLQDARERGRLERIMCRNGHVYDTVGFTRQSDRSKVPGKKQCLGCIRMRHPMGDYCKAICQDNCHGQRGRRCRRWVAYDKDYCPIHLRAARVEAEQAREAVTVKPRAKLEDLMDAQLDEGTRTVAAF